MVPATLVQFLFFWKIPERCVGLGLSSWELRVALEGGGGYLGAVGNGVPPGPVCAALPGEAAARWGRRHCPGAHPPQTLAPGRALHLDACRSQPWLSLVGWKRERSEAQRHLGPQNAQAPDKGTHSAQTAQGPAHTLSAHFCQSRHNSQFWSMYSIHTPSREHTNYIQAHIDLRTTPQ